MYLFRSWPPCCPTGKNRVGQEACVAGAEETDPPEGLGPGELCLHTENASIWVRSNGRVDIWGDLYINGVKYRPFILG